MHVTAADSELYNIMDTVIKENRPCLCPIETPPGSGKSTAMESIIADSILADEGRQFFIVSTQHNNLNSSEKHLKQILAGHNPDELILRLYGIADTAMIFYRETLANKGMIIPKVVTDSKEYRQLMSVCCECSNSCKDDRVPAAWEKIVSDMYRDARNAISKMLSGEVDDRPTSDEKRRKYVEDHEEWHFLYRMFPVMRISSAKVVIMTMTKFFSPSRTPVKYYVSLFDSVSDKSVIFFDESDADIIAARDSILSSAVKNSADIIDMFHDVRNIHDRDNRYLLSVCKSDGKPLDIIEKKARELYKQYHFMYPFRTTNDVRARSDQRFLFHTGAGTFCGHGGELFVHFDKKNHVNIIYTPAKDEKNKIVKLGRSDPDVLQVVTALYKFIRDTVMNQCYYLATGYFDNHGKLNKMTYLESFRTVLKLLGFHDDIQRFLVDNLFVGLRPEDEREKSAVDRSFFERGFTISSLHDDRNHNENTEMWLYACTGTPEKAIAHLAEHSTVFMVSATALLESVLKNGCYTWFGERLGDKLRLLTDEEDNRLSAWLDTQSDYDTAGVKIHPMIIGGRTNLALEKQASKLFLENGIRSEAERQDFIKRVVNNVNSAIQSLKDRAFLGSRYMEFLGAYSIYANKEIESMLAIGPLYLNGGPEFNMQIMAKCCALIDEYYNLPDYRRLPKDASGNPFIHQLKTKEDTMNGRSFDEQKQDLDDNYFKQGCNCFVYTVFKCAGIGQNLQHHYRLGTHVVRVNGYQDEEMKDYDAVYVMNPTYVFDGLENDGSTTAEGVLKAVYQIENMADPAAGELTCGEERNVLNAYMGGGKSRQCGVTGLLHNSNALLLGKASVIIQAVGRASRTCWRSKDIYMILSADAYPALARVGLNRHHFTKEAEALIATSKSKADCMGAGTMKSGSAEDIVRRKNYYDVQTIDVLRRRDDKNGVKVFLHSDKWECLRNEILKLVPDESAYLGLSYETRAMYAKVDGLSCDHYTYNQQNDYRTVTVSFDDGDVLPYNVSVEAARLDLVLMIPGMTDYFRRWGWATQFGMNQYIMTPVAFNNIYKAAIGEVSGVFVLNGIPDIYHPEPIKDQANFEMFDAWFPALNYYIDFKSYSESNDTLDVDVLQKAAQKAHFVGTDMVIFMQSVTPGQYEPRKDVVDGVTMVEIPGYYYVDNSILVPNIKCRNMIQEVLHV